MRGERKYRKKVSGFGVRQGKIVKEPQKGYLTLIRK